MKKRKYRLLLINPLNKHRKGFVLNTGSTYPPINLGIIAALTPPNWEVEILDENYDDFEMRDADLVGITAFTAQAFRAYELSEMFRKNGAETVIGGIHASMMPEEAAGFADGVVIGEAESTWQKVIHDFEHGNLKKTYTGEHIPMDDFPAARHDLFSPLYTFTSIQTTRGCPMRCEFCSVHTFNGSRYRQRPVANVLDEMEIMPHDKMFIVDDNIIGYSKQSEKRAISLFEGMIKRGIKKEWFTQASLNIADNEEVLRLMFEAGCRMIFLGIESEKEAQLKEQKKKLNVRIVGDKYQEVFRKIHEHGISILGSFIFGMDADSVEDLHSRADFILDSPIDCYQTGILVPLPGTGTFGKFDREGRLLFNDFPRAWQHYNVFEVVIKPKQMKAEILEKEMNSIWNKLYSRNTITQKFLKARRATGSTSSAAWSLGTNIHYHNMVFEGEKFISVKDLIFNSESGSDNIVQHVR